MKKKQLIPEVGDIVKLKPIALLIAEKQIKLVNNKAVGYNTAYDGGPTIAGKMMPNFRGARKVRIRYVSQTRFTAGGIKSKDTWSYKLSWIQSIKKKK